MEGNSEQVWLCVVNKENFEVVKEKRVYGVPARAHNQIGKIRVGDILVFYVISPIRCILGISKSTSSTFEEKKLFPWKDRIYPYRIEISEVEEVRVRSKEFIGKISSIKNRIPMGTSLIPISRKDYETIRLLANQK